MYEEQIRRGVELLDSKSPGWRSKIDIPNLDMFSNCIMHQLYGKFIGGAQELGINRAHEAENYGLDTRSSYKLLTAEWKAYLEATNV